MLDSVDLMDALITPSACVMRIKADIPVSALIATLQSLPAMFVVSLCLSFSGEKKISKSELDKIFILNFPRTFFSTDSRAIAARRAEWQAYQCLKKCGKIQNVVSNSDFEIFFSWMHALKFIFFWVSSKNWYINVYKIPMSQWSHVPKYVHCIV